MNEMETKMNMDQSSDMTMTCVCHTEVSSIVLMPSSNKVVVNSTTTTTLSTGEVLDGKPSSVNFAIPEGSTMVADILALVPEIEPMQT
jgi:hypothetical protein